MIHAFDGSWDRLIHIHPFQWMVKCIRVLWTDSLSNVPAGISSIAQTTENMASNK